MAIDEIREAQMNRFDLQQHKTLRQEVVLIQFLEVVILLFAFYISVRVLVGDLRNYYGVVIPLTIDVTLWLSAKLGVMQARLGQHVKQLEAFVYGSEREARKRGWEIRKDVTGSNRLVGRAGVIVVALAYGVPLLLGALQIWGSGVLSRLLYAAFSAIAFWCAYEYATKPRKLGEIQVIYDPKYDAEDWVFAQLLSVNPHEVIEYPATRTLGNDVVWLTKAARARYGIHVLADSSMTVESFIQRLEKSSQE